MDLVTLSHYAWVLGLVGLVAAFVFYRAVVARPTGSTAMTELADHFVLVPENAAPLLITELLPSRHLNYEAKAVSQRGIKKLCSYVNIGGLLIPLGRWRWVHGGPTVAQFVQVDTLDPAFVNYREEFILQLRPSTVDLVEKHDLCVPDGLGRADIAEVPALFVGDRNADKVVIVDQTCVVESEVKPEGIAYNGQIYPSLSAVAKAVTGAHWSGNRFFGLPQTGGVA